MCVELFVYFKGADDEIGYTRRGNTRGAIRFLLREYRLELGKRPGVPRGGCPCRKAGAQRALVVVDVNHDGSEYKVKKKNLCKMRDVFETDSGTTVNGLVTQREKGRERLSSREGGRGGRGRNATENGEETGEKVDSHQCGWYYVQV